MKLHVKSVFFGMGIGIILTAIIGMIFFLGYTPEMDKAKVMELARKYGMVDSAEIRKPLEVTISKEDTVKAITEKLVSLGLVEDAVTFQIKIINRNAKDNIISGNYEFTGLESEDEIIDKITGK